MTDLNTGKDAVQQFYAAEAVYLASEARDFAPVALTLSNDILLCEPASLPYGGEYRGHAAFERWLKHFADTWASMEVRDSQMFLSEDHVCSRSHVFAVLRANGAKVNWPLLQLFRVKDGRVAELRPFHWDTAAMLAAFTPITR